MTPDKCMQEINIDTEETLIDIQVQDTNIYILTNLQAILTFSITVVGMNSLDCLMSRCHQIHGCLANHEWKQVLAA